MKKIPVYVIPTAIVAVVARLSVWSLISVSAIRFVTAPSAWEKNVDILRINVLYLFLVLMLYVLHYLTLKKRHKRHKDIQPKGIIVFHAMVIASIAFALVGSMLLLFWEHPIPQWLQIQYAMIIGSNIIVFVYYWLYTHIRNKTYIG